MLGFRGLGHACGQALVCLGQSGPLASLDQPCRAGLCTLPVTWWEHVHFLWAATPTSAVVSLVCSIHRGSSALPLNLVLSLTLCLLSLP